MKITYCRGESVVQKQILNFQTKRILSLDNVNVHLVKTIRRLS